MATEDENRAAIESAIYAEIQRRIDEGLEEGMDSTGETPMILAWAVSYEYVTGAMVEADSTAGGVIAMSNTKSRSASRGVLELGVDRYRV